MGRDVVYQGKGEEAMLRVVGGEEAWSRAAPNKWYYNPAGPFKWKINSAGWVYVAKPSVLKVAGGSRFGWKVYRIEKDGMMKESDVQFFSTKEEAMSKFNALNSNSLRSRNAVVQKALNATARNMRAIPVDAKGKGIIERCKIRTADGEVGEVAHIDEDGFVYFKSKDGRVRGVSADTVTRLNAQTSVLRETAVNAGWKDFKKGDRVRSRITGKFGVITDIKDSFVPGGDKVQLWTRDYIVKWDGEPGEKYASQADIIANSRSTNAVVAKALNARRVAKNFTPQSEFQVGDVVRFRDSVRSVPHDETYTVVKVSGNNITIKGGRDNGTSVEFKNNLEIA